MNACPCSMSCLMPQLVRQPAKSQAITASSAHDVIIHIGVTFVVRWGVWCTSGAFSFEQLQCMLTKQQVITGFQGIIGVQVITDLRYYLSLYLILCWPLYHPYLIVHLILLMFHQFLLYVSDSLPRAVLKVCYFSETDHPDSTRMGSRVFWKGTRPRPF